MSARDEPITEPPPAGEHDAYSAETKVGAMPEEVMAKLRAEGLLPPEDAPPRPPRPGPPRPSSNLRGPQVAAERSQTVSERPSGVSEPPSSSVGDFDSDAPEDETALSPLLQASHASSVAFVAPGEGAVGPKPTSVETPIAFSATEGGGAPLEPTALADLEAQAMTSSASTRRLAIVGIAIVAIVLLVALLSYGR